MAKHLKLQCWNCPKVYFYSLDDAGQQEVVVSCPYCRADGILDLRPYPDMDRMVYRRGESESSPLDDDDILPTRKRI